VSFVATHRNIVKRLLGVIDDRVRNERSRRLFHIFIWQAAGASLA
jgi:hypothetical protein